MLQKILNRNLLKYSAGRAITCKCGKIADYRHWVIWTSPAGQTGVHCADCWREGLALVHDDKPHAYLLSIGWQVNTLVDFDKKPRTVAQIPQKAGKKLDTYLRRTILACHKLDRKTRLKTVYPALVYRSDTQLTVNDDGECSSPSLTAEYVARYCKLNNLKVA